MKTRNVTATLRPLSALYKRRVRSRYNGPTTLNQQARVALAQAIFDVENDAEHKYGTHHPQVKIMNAVRNCLQDDTGENERFPGTSHPFQEALEPILAERRRAGNPKALQRARGEFEDVLHCRVCRQDQPRK